MPLGSFEMFPEWTLTVSWFKIPFPQNKAFFCTWSYFQAEAWLKNFGLALCYLDNMRWDLLPPWDVCCRFFCQFIELTVSSCFGITIAATAAQKRFDEICREKGEGKGRSRSQIIRVKIIFYKGCGWRVLLPPHRPRGLVSICTVGVVVLCLSNWLWERMRWGHREVDTW